MNLEVAEELLSYNTWANRRMLEAVSVGRLRGQEEPWMRC